jgi:hypothetical protein
VELYYRREPFAFYIYVERVQELILLLGVLYFALECASSPICLCLRRLHVELVVVNLRRETTFSLRVHYTFDETNFNAFTSVQLTPRNNT